MRKLILLLVLGLLLPVGLQAQSSAKDVLINETDPFTGTRAIISRYVEIPTDNRHITASVAIAYVDDTSGFYLDIVSTDGWQFLRTKTAYFLIDGVRLSKPIMSVGTEVESGFVQETFFIPVDLTPLMGAEAVQWKMENTIFTWTAEVDRVGQAVIDRAN